MEIYSSRRGIRRFQPTFTGTSNYISPAGGKNASFQNVGQEQNHFLAMVI